MESDPTDLIGQLRTNFTGPELGQFRNIFNVVLIKLQGQGRFEELRKLTENVLFLCEKSQFAWCESLFLTPPFSPLQLLRFVRFSRTVVEEMLPLAQAGSIAHEICHLLCGHRTFAFFDRGEPQPDYERPAVIIEGEGEIVTDLKVIRGESLTKKEEAEANGLARLLGFKSELDAAFDFIERRKNR